MKKLPLDGVGGNQMPDPFVFILVVVAGFVLLPVLTFLCVKFGTAAYLLTKNRLERRNKNGS
jgi:hypothetical protein